MQANRASLRLSAAALTFLSLLPATVLADVQRHQALAAGAENQLGLTFSPDGRTAFWVEWDGRWGSGEATQKRIYTAQHRDGAWSKPQPVPFSENYSDDDPFVSPDGEWLYFVSDRPVAGSSNDARDSNIWRYRLAGGETQAEHLSINSTKAEYSPVVTASGALYFASDRDGGLGQGDIYRAPRHQDGFGAAERLGPAINSSTGEWNLWIAADETELIFEASSRPTNVSIPGDLYYSWQTPGGWTSAVPIRSLNTGGSDLMPRPHPTDDDLYYTTAPIGGHARIERVRWSPLRAELRAGYAPVLLVANRSSHEVTFVDLAAGKVVARIATGDGPHLLSNVSDARVLATGYGEFPRPHDEPVAQRPPFEQSLNSRLTLIDTRNRAVLLERTIDACDKPHASWIVAARAYVTCETEQQVVAIDLETGRTVDRFATAQAGSHVLGFEEKSRQLAVTNTGSGSVTLINVDDGSTKVVPLANGSEGLLVVGDQIWVSNTGAGSVSVVDPGTAAEVAKTDRICSFPIAFGHNAPGVVWVACFGNAQLISLDASTLAVRQSISLADQPLNVLLHPSRALAYVSLPRANAVAEIDLDSGSELRRIRVGIEPDGLRWGETPAN